MAQTSSLSFPNLIDPTRNCVSVLEDNRSITNRTKLLLLTDPTELYNEPMFGVGLKKFLWQYNTENTKARVKDKIVEQLDMWEPCVVAEHTSFADGLLFTEGMPDPTEFTDPNQLKLTVGLETTFGDKLDIDLNDVQGRVDIMNS